MIQSIKELIFVMALTVPIWMVGKAFFGNSVSAEVFRSRRNTWLIVTVLGFLSPNIFIYAAFAGPAIYRAGKRDTSPISLFILLFFAIPNAAVPLSSIGIDLLPISPHRILAITLLPAFIFSNKTYQEIADLRWFDIMLFLLLTFVALGIFLGLPYHSFTHTLRLITVATLDTIVLYLGFRLLGSHRGLIRDGMASWVFSGVLLSVVAVFESYQGWLLYVGINSRWGSENAFSYLMREGSLRAQASAGHSLTLGIWLVVAWAFYLALQRGWQSKRMRFAVAALLLGGLWSCASRGAWLAALLSSGVYLGLNPNGLGRGVKAIAISCFGVLLFVISPLGDKFVSYLPFVGSVDSYNVDYRVKLFTVCIDLIKMNPVFGNQLAINQMQELRQGQGIIDLVNGYLQIAVFNGLIALGLFVGLLVVGVVRAVTAWNAIRRGDVELAYLGSSLVAAMLGTLLFIATAGIDPMTYMLAGMLSSYWCLSFGVWNKNHRIPDLQALDIPPPTHSKKSYIDN